MGRKWWHDFRRQSSSFPRGENILKAESLSRIVLSFSNIFQTRRKLFSGILCVYVCLCQPYCSALTLDGRFFGGVFRWVVVVGLLAFFDSCLYVGVVEMVVGGWGWMSHHLHRLCLQQMSRRFPREA